MMASSSLAMVVLICCIGVVLLFESSDAKVEDKWKVDNPYTGFREKDASDADLEDDVIDIALGDGVREVFSEIVMTPELKANKMSLNKKHIRTKENKMKLRGKKSISSQKTKETPFDKYLPNGGHIRTAKNVINL